LRRAFVGVEKNTVRGDSFAAAFAPNSSAAVFRSNLANFVG
jgi:hypothetical protein